MKLLRLRQGKLNFSFASQRSVRPFYPFPVISCKSKFMEPKVREECRYGELNVRDVLSGVLELLPGNVCSRRTD